MYHRTQVEGHLAESCGENGSRDFLNLVEAVVDCRHCPRMVGRTRVLGSPNGPITARILFVAEAPGRFGADVSGVPLSGDRTGHTFEYLLAGAGFDRHTVFVTNAVLCNPRNDAGCNDRPTRQEIKNCSTHLRSLIGIVRPEWVVALGAVALGALGILEPHGLILKHDVGFPKSWFGRQLVPLYHPGPRALIHRPLIQQRADYAKLAALTGGSVH